MRELRCPNCGQRGIEEYRYGEIPRVPDEIRDPDARDVDMAWMRNNPEGETTERWYHEGGCRRWMTLTRDTRD